MIKVSKAGSIGNDSLIRVYRDVNSIVVPDATRDHCQALNKDAELYRVIHGTAVK